MLSLFSLLLNLIACFYTILTVQAIYRPYCMFLDFSPYHFDGSLPMIIIIVLSSFITVMSMDPVTYCVMCDST